MRPEVHWIGLPASTRLAIMARPRAGDWLADEIAGWRAEGIDVIVSLLNARSLKVPDTEGQRDWVDMFREAAKTGGIKAG